MTQIEIVKALSDNYIYILHNPINKQTAVIDPGEAQPVIELLEEKKWNLSHIFNTHSHNDHIAGNQQLIDKYKCKLIAPNYDQNKIHFVTFMNVQNNHDQNEIHFLIFINIQNQLFLVL